MQVVRDIGYIKQQQRRGRRLTILGLVALSIAFVLVWQQGQVGLVLLAYAAMMSGWVLFTLGLQTVTKFSSNRRKLRNDQELDQALERLNDRYALVHYPALGSRRPEHLLVHQAGVLVLTVRELPGRIGVKGTKWRRLGNPFARFVNASGPQLGNPTAENRQQVELVQSYLAENDLPDAVDGVIVFTHPTVTVHVTDSPIDVVDLEGLPDYVRGLGQDRPPLTTKQRLSIVEALSQGQELEQATLRGERRRRAA